MQKTAIVVPCYNEARRFEPESFVAFALAQPALSFVFVDDGSTDGTFDVLSRASERAPNQLSVLRLEINAGKAEAVRRGVLSAFESSAELIGFWDADLATPLYNIEEFAHVLQRPQVQLAIGSRVRLLGRRVQRNGFRHYTGRLFATLAALALRLPVYDTQCGAKVFRANVLFREIFSEPFEVGWSFDVEIIARLARIARRNGTLPEDLVVEIPLQEWIDAPGSKLRASHAPRIAGEMARLFAIARRP
ncbi:MAG TPA: glycosyltransferase [Polyangiaceae bacterium]|jgi:glycosyltransferase involved in cell wall biosynthesis|nr:glycosyltransferase [Polyangiaceae bacterium]